MPSEKTTYMFPMKKSTGLGNKIKENTSQMLVVLRSPLKQEYFKRLFPRGLTQVIFIIILLKYVPIRKME